MPSRKYAGEKYFLHILVSRQQQIAEIVTYV